MVTSTPTLVVDTHSVRLRIDDPAATIDFGHHPDYPDPARVTELAVIYETRIEDGQPGDTIHQVTAISYVVDHAEHQSAFVHPDFLDQPHEWPAWARELIEVNHPDAHADHCQQCAGCPQCGARAVGTRIPKHDVRCPRNDPNF